MHSDIKVTVENKKGRFVNISLIVICQGFQNLIINGISLFLPVIRKDLNISLAQGGILSSANTLVYALMQIPTGFAADRLRAIRLFIIGLFGVTILAFLFGLITDFRQALLISSISGLFRALMFVPGMALIVAWFHPERRATAMGLFMLGGLFITAIINVLGPFLVGKFDWRFPFLSFASVGFIAALVLWRFSEDPPGTSAVQKMNLAEVASLFKSPAMWVCGGIQFVRLAVAQGITFWLPTLLIEEKGLSLQLTGIIIAFRTLSSAPSNLIGGYISDRLKNPTVVIGGALVVLMVTTALMVVLNNLVLLITVIIINSVFIQIYFGPLFAVPLEITNNRNAGTLTGFGNLFANVGALVCTYFLGVLKEATGSFMTGFFTVGVACFIGIAFTVLLWRIRAGVLMAKKSGIAAGE